MNNHQPQNLPLCGVFNTCLDSDEQPPGEYSYVYHPQQHQNDVLGNGIYRKTEHALSKLLVNSIEDSDGKYVRSDLGDLKFKDLINDNIETEFGLVSPVCEESPQFSYNDNMKTVYTTAASAQKFQEHHLHIPSSRLINGDSFEEIGIAGSVQGMSPPDHLLSSYISSVHISKLQPLVNCWNELRVNATLDMSPADAINENSLPPLSNFLSNCDYNVNLSSQNDSEHAAGHAKVSCKFSGGEPVTEKISGSLHPNYNPNLSSDSSVTVNSLPELEANLYLLPVSSQSNLALRHTVNLDSVLNINKNSNSKVDGDGLLPRLLENQRSLQMLEDSNSTYITFKNQSDSNIPHVGTCIEVRTHGFGVDDLLPLTETKNYSLNERVDEDGMWKNSLGPTTFGSSATTPDMTGDGSHASQIDSPQEFCDDSFCKKLPKRSERIKRRRPVSPPVHSESHCVRDVRKIFSCKDCKARLTSSSSLRIHYRLHTGERPYKCNQCDKSFLKKSNLSTHVRNHSGEKPHNCSECGRSFRLLSTLKSHMFTHTGEQPFRCEICRASFTQRSSLARHKITHTNIKPFICEHCGNSFQNKDYFKKHLFNHNLKSKYACQICGKGFKNSKGLGLHIMSHNQGDNPFKCSKCYSAFSSAKQYRQHVRRVHENNKQELRCEECDAIFRRKEYLKAHMKVHQGDNIFKCDVCKASFNHLGTHRKHMRRHVKQEVLTQKKLNSENASRPSRTMLCYNFACRDCNKVYKTNRQLKAHVCYTSTSSEEQDNECTSTSSSDIHFNTPYERELRFSDNVYSYPETYAATELKLSRQFKLLETDKEAVDKFQLLEKSISAKLSEKTTFVKDHYMGYQTDLYNSDMFVGNGEPSAVNLLSAALQVATHDKLTRS